MFSMINASTNAACEAAHPSDRAACVFAPVVFPYLTSNMFVLEGPTTAQHSARTLCRIRALF
jgi:hypothetical protein